MLYLHGLEFLLYLTKSLGNDSDSSSVSPKCGVAQGSVSIVTAVIQAVISPIMYCLGLLAGLLLLILSQYNPVSPLPDDFSQVQT